MTMTNNFKQGFTAELVAFITAYSANLSQVNMILETILLTIGIASSAYGFYMFIKKPKK